MAEQLVTIADTLKLSPAIDEAVELFAKQAYVAENLPNSERHVELPGELIKMPNDADVVDVQVERAYDAAITSGNVIKCRAEISLDGGQTFCPQADGRKDWPWGVFPVGFQISALMDDLQPDPLKQKSSVTIPLPPGSNRVVRVTFIPLQDVTAGVSVVAKQR